MAAVRHLDLWDKFWDDPQREFGGIFTVQNFKNGEGLSPFSFPPIPRDVATSEAGCCAFVIDLN